MADAQHLPQGRRQAGDRHLNFHETRDNLPADLTRLYARLLKSGRADHRAGTGLSHRSVAYVATIIGKCLGAAVRGELLISNPARRAKVPRAGSDGRQHESMRTWSSEDIARFLDLTRTHRFNAERPLLGTGYVDHDLVFAHPDGRPLHRERFSRTFGEQVARHGLPPLSIHGLRHSWATLALQAGVHPKVVQERLGHSTIGITLDVYSHVLPSMETDAAERVAALTWTAAREQPVRSPPQSEACDQSVTNDLPGARTSEAMGP